MRDLNAAAEEEGAEEGDAMTAAGSADSAALATGATLAEEGREPAGEGAEDGWETVASRTCLELRLGSATLRTALVERVLFLDTHGDGRWRPWTRSEDAWSADQPMQRPVQRSISMSAAPAPRTATHAVLASGDRARE